jgi:hypothetical protein
MITYLLCLLVGSIVGAGVALTYMYYRVTAAYDLGYKDGVKDGYDAAIKELTEA